MYRARGRAAEEEAHGAPCYLVFALAPHGRALFTGIESTPAQIQPQEQSPEGAVKLLGHTFGL